MNDKCTPNSFKITLLVLVFLSFSIWVNTWFRRWIFLCTLSFIYIYIYQRELAAVIRQPKNVMQGFEWPWTLLTNSFTLTKQRDINNTAEKQHCSVLSLFNGKSVYNWQFGEQLFPLLPNHWNVILTNVQAAHDSLRRVFF